jgi:hypothetical protein
MPNIFDEALLEMEAEAAPQGNVFDIAEQSFNPAPVADAVVSRASEFVPLPAPALESDSKPQPESRSSVLRRGVADPLLSLSKGVIGLPEAFVGLLDIPTMGYAGKILEAGGYGFQPKIAKDWISEFQSPELKTAKGKVHDAKGFLNTVLTALKNPSSIADVVVESVPQLLGGAAIARKGLAIGGKVLKPLVAAAIGEGAISAGSAAEQFRQASEDGLLTPKQAALALSSGVATSLLGVMGGKLARRLDIEDLDTLLARGTAEAINRKKKSVLTRIIQSALVEGVVEELPQSLQERIQSNIAQDRPWDEGVAEDGAMGMLAGLVTGGVTGGVTSSLSRRSSPPVTPESGTRVQRAIRQRQEALGRNQVEAAPTPVAAPVPQVQPPVEPEVMTPKPEWLVNITPPETLRGKQLPAAIQVDMMDGDVNLGSTNPNELRARGVAFPSQEDLLKLPKGKYTLDQVQKMLEGQKKLKENEVVDEKAKPSPEVVAPGSLPVVAGQSVIIPQEGQVEARVAQPQGADQARAQPTPVLKGGVPSEVQEKVQGEAGVLTTETPAAVSPEAAAPVQKKSTPRSDSQEFDKLLAEHGMERDWVTDPDGFYADIGKYGDTASIEGNKKKSKAYQAARRRAAIDIGLKPDDVDTIQGRAKALPKLKEYLAKLNEPDVQEDKETGSTDFLPASEAAAESVAKQEPAKPVEPVEQPVEAKPSPEAVEAKAIGSFKTKGKDSTGTWRDETVTVLSIAEPVKLARPSSDGGWQVSFEVPSTLGKTGRQVRTRGFFKKADALAWIEEVKRGKPVEPPAEVKPVNEPVDTIAGRMTLDEFDRKGYAPEQVTRQDWINLQRANRRFLGQQEGGDSVNAPNAEYEEFHKNAVKSALAKNEEVDPEVLKDYPDLASPKVAPKAEAAEKPAKTLPVALAKRLLELSRERQTDGFGPANESLRQDIIEAIHGKRPPKSKAGATAVRVALANLFGIDSKAMAPVQVEEKIREALQAIVAGEKKVEPENVQQESKPAEAKNYSVENPPKLYEKVRWKGEDGEVTTAMDGSGKVRFQSFTWDNFVPVNEIERIEEPKPPTPKPAKPVAKLSASQLKRLSELVKKQRAADDEGGKALTPEEVRELESLRAVGQEDLIAEPTGANEAAERGEIVRLRAKAKELRRQAQLAQQRWMDSRVTEVANKHRADANNLEKEAIAAENDADAREFKLKQAGADVKPSGDFGLEGETEKKDDGKDDKGPPPPPDPPDLFANLGSGLEAGRGWNEAGIREAIRGEYTAGFKVNVVSADQAEKLTGRPEARGWGGFFKSGEVYLVSDNIERGNQDGARRLLREEVGHGLLRTEAGQKLLREAVDAGKVQLTAAEKKALTDQGYPDHGNTLLDEFIAKSAMENRSWWKDLLARVIRFFQGKGFNPTNAEAARLLLRQIRSELGTAKPEDAGAMLPEVAAGRPEPLKQAVEMFERKAAVDPAAAQRAVEIGQAANVLARQGVVRGTLTSLEGIARGEAATPQQKWLRDLASKVLANPFIRNALRRPVERLNASASYTGDTIESYQTLKAKPDATPEQVSNASGEAVNNIVSWEQRVADFNSAYLAKRQSLTNGIAKTAEAEMEAYDKLDAADVLLSDFRSMALPILRQSNDTTALQAYTYALGRSQAVRNVLAWVGREVDLTGASTPADVLNLIREAGGRSRIQESIEQQIGAERGVIQAVSRIIALVEPIRERLVEARFLYRQQAQTRSTELKQRLERLVAQGSYARALEVFERGAEKLGAEQDRARRELDFYARRTRQQLLALRALDEVKAISERIANDPGFQAEKREVFGESAQNVRNVMVDIRGSTFVLKPFGGMTEELHLTFGNPTAQSRASLEQIKTYRDRAMAYIASDNSDPSVAQGLKATFPLLEQFLNPAVSPEAERLLPNFMLKGFHALLRRIGAPERIPYYLLQGAGGTWKAVADATLRARRDMGEQLQRINKAHFPKMSLALHAALKSHGEITPDTYFEKVWNHLAGSRQNFRDIRYLNEGDPIGNGEKVTKEDLAYLEAYRKFHADLSATSQNIGKRQFSSFRSVLTGIFFDKDGRVRLPFAQGVDMVNRRQPPQYEIEDWLNKWRAAKTPDAKSEFLTDYLDRLVIGYMHGVNQADWVRKFPYSYEAQIREILAESAEQPIDSFDTLVDRVFEKVTVEENEVPPTWEDVRNNLLFDFDSIFKKLERLDTTQKQTDPKNIVETVRSEREFNTERGDVIMPPNWYDYGGVTEGQWSSVSRASMFPYERAHLVAINGIKDALSAVVKDFEQQSKARNEGFRGYFRTKRESRKARERGELIYSWADAKELLDKVTHYAAGLKMMAEQPQLLTQTDRPYAVLQSGVTQLPVAMVLFRLGAASRNLFGGYTNAMLADMAFRNRSWAISVPLRSAELVADTYKNLLTALVHEGNPVGRKIHALLSSASSRAVIGPIAENFLKAIDEQRQLYRDAAELGLNLNVALWDSLSTLRKFAKTAGNVREPGSPLERIYSVPAAALRMGGMVFGQAGVGKIDSWINTKAYIQARQYEQIYKKMARKYGEQVISMGLDQFPPNAFGGSYKAVKVREFFTRMAGLDIDAAMRDYYKRWSESGTDADGDLVPLFTEEQRNTLAVATADDFNLATFSNRPYSTKMHSMLNTLGLFYGYPDWWIHKLLSTANLNSRKGLTEGRLENMPFLLNYALLFALASIMGMEGVEWLKEWLLNQKSAYPTLTDAKTAPAAVRAAAGAVAFNTPFIGGAVSSAFDLGYHGSNNPYDLFFIPGMLKAAANVGVETWQTGEPVLPMMKFADRYLLPVPSHKLTDATAGSRALVNTGNILEMSARANDDEEKLKPRDAAGFQRDYTPATPIVTRAMNAIGNGDMPEFQKEYNALVQEYRRQGKSDPERNARQSLMTRNPISQRFAKRPTEAEFAKYLDGLTETERKIVTDTLNNYRQAMGIIGAAPSFTAGEARGGGGGSTSFRPTGSAAAFATAATGAPARFSGSRVRSALSTSRSRYPRRVRGVRTRLTAARRRPRRVSRIRTSRVRRAKLPRFSTRIRRPRRIRISPRRQFV